MKTKNILIASMIIFILVFVIANFLFNFSTPENVFVVEEGMLEKNKGLTLLPDEEYTYLINKGEDGNILFAFRYIQGCMEILVYDSPSGVCLDSEGLDVEESNLNFVNPQITFFKPWMLALEDDWTWEVEYRNRHTNESIVTYHFEVIGEETIYGRDSYIVQITGPSLDITQWIDKEKRIILTEDGTYYNLDIVDAPFELEKTS